MLGLGWLRMKNQNSAFSEFCNVGARPEFIHCETYTFRNSPYKQIWFGKLEN